MYVEQKLKVLYSTEKPLRRKREGEISREKCKGSQGGGVVKLKTDEWLQFPGILKVVLKGKTMLPSNKEEV